MNSELFEAVKKFLNNMKCGDEEILWRNINGKKVFYAILFDGINYSLLKYIRHEDFTEKFPIHEDLMITMCAKLVCE